MGARMRAFDWSETPLGAPETWPQSLKTAVHIMLTSRFAMWMAWGPELTFLCNDAYLPTTGLKRDWLWERDRTTSGLRSGTTSVLGSSTCSALAKQRVTSSYASISIVVDFAKKPTIHFLIRR